MTDMRIAIAGLGTIGRGVARSSPTACPGRYAACVAARDEEKAKGWLDEEGIEVRIVALMSSRRTPTSPSSAPRPRC